MPSETSLQINWAKPADELERIVPVVRMHQEKLSEIRLAIEGYYAELDQRKHGGVAQNTALQKIEQILGMRWVQGASLQPKV